MTARALNVATHLQPGRAEVSRAHFSTRVEKPLYRHTRWYIMTRKHFRAIAQILRKHKEVIPDSLVRDFANMCAEHNDYFKRETFIKACYYEVL